MYDSTGIDLEESSTFYECSDKEFKINHLLFMDDLKKLGPNRFTSTNCTFLQRRYQDEIWNKQESGQEKLGARSCRAPIVYLK